MDFQVIQATDPEFVDMLEIAGLPVHDLGGVDQTFWAARNGAGEIVAAGGLERCGGDVIMRSVVVREHLRGKGLGGKLVVYLTERAFARQAGTIFLLTEMPTDFFSAHGFHLVDRTRVPDPVAASAQFSKICPDSAVAMCRGRE